MNNLIITWNIWIIIIIRTTSSTPITSIISAKKAAKRIAKLQLKLNEAKRTKQALLQAENDGNFEFKATYRKPSDPPSSGGRRGSQWSRKYSDKSSKHKNYETDEEPPQMDLATLAKAKLLAKDIGK